MTEEMGVDVPERSRVKDRGVLIDIGVVDPLLLEDVSSGRSLSLAALTSTLRLGKNNPFPDGSLETASALEELSITSYREN
jgi:hypothetical protein